MKAFKLINTADNLSAFEEGTFPDFTHLKADYFFAATTIEEYQRHAHPAPRYQFVVTLKGKLKFTVSNGSSFIIEPGILLIANDLKGEGHTWELIDGDEWHRIYIVLPTNSPDHFKIKN